MIEMCERLDALVCDLLKTVAALRRAFGACNFPAGKLKMNLDAKSIVCMQFSILTRRRIPYCTFGTRHRASAVDTGSAILCVHLSPGRKLPFGYSLRCTFDCTHSNRSSPTCIEAAAAIAHGADCPVDAKPSLDRFDCDCTDRSLCCRSSRLTPSYTNIESIRPSRSDRCARESTKSKIDQLK